MSHSRVELSPEPLGPCIIGTCLCPRQSSSFASSILVTVTLTNAIQTVTTQKADLVLASHETRALVPHCLNIEIDGRDCHYLCALVVSPLFASPRSCQMSESWGSLTFLDNRVPKNLDLLRHLIDVLWMNGLFSNTSNNVLFMLVLTCSTSLRLRPVHEMRHFKENFLSLHDKYATKILLNGAARIQTNRDWCE